MKLKALREKRAKLIAEMRGILDAAAKDNDRELSAEEVAQYDAKKAEIAKLDAQIARLEEQERLDASLREPEDDPEPSPTRALGDPAIKEFESFGQFMFAVAYDRNDQRLSWHDRPVKGEQRMDTGPKGGFAVPAQFRDQLMRVDPQGAIIRPRATVIPAGSPPDAPITMPALDQDGAAPANMYGGVQVRKVAEGAPKPGTEFGLRQITLEPQEFAGTMEATDKLLRNWTAASSVIEMLFRQAMVATEDTEFLKGNGVGGPLGLLNAGATFKVARAVANQISYDDLVNMVARLRGPGVWVYSKSVLPQLMKLVDGDGRLIWQINAREGEPSILLGRPAVENERNPLLGALGDIWLADLSMYLVKDGSGPFVASSEHVKFVENRTVFKIFWNVDGQPWLTKPIQGENGYETSPFVALNIP